MKQFTVIILTRDDVELKPLTEYRPKTLLKVLGKPLIQYLIDVFKNVGLRSLILITKNPQTYSKELQLEGLDVEYVTYSSNSWKGLLNALELVTSEEVVIAYGDVITSEDAIKALITDHLVKSSECSLMAVPVISVKNYVKLDVDEEGRVRSAELSYEKTPGYIFGNIAVMNRKFMKFLMNVHGDLLEFLSKYVKNYNVHAIPWTELWISIEYPWDLIIAAKALLDKLSTARISLEAKISAKAVIEGPVIIDEQAEIDHDAIIRGPVYIGRKVYVGNNALIRNYSCIEDNCTIGANTEIVESIIQPKVTIGRGVFIGNSVIGEEVIVEPGVVTLSVLPPEIEIEHIPVTVVKGKRMIKLGVIIGSKARIGANSVIYPGTVINAKEIINPLSTVKSR